MTKYHQAMEHELHSGQVDPEHIDEHMRKTFRAPHQSFKDRFKRMSVDYQRNMANHTKDLTESPTTL
jgi:serine/threonine protein phosphatase PrpC